MQKIAHRLLQDIFGVPTLVLPSRHSHVQSRPGCRGWTKVVLDDCLVSSLLRSGSAVLDKASISVVSSGTFLDNARTPSGVFNWHAEACKVVPDSRT